MSPLPMWKAPGGDELSALGLKAVVDCVNTEEAHESAETALTTENCAIGDPVRGEDGVYTSTITVEAEAFVAAYAGHVLADGEDDVKSLTPHLERCGSGLDGRGNQRHL